jgi:hypothetical protein
VTPGYVGFVLKYGSLLEIASRKRCLSKPKLYVPFHKLFQEIAWTATVFWKKWRALSEVLGSSRPRRLQLG